MYIYVMSHREYFYLNRDILYLLILSNTVSLNLPRFFWHPRTSIGQTYSVCLFYKSVLSLLQGRWV